MFDGTILAVAIYSPLGNCGISGIAEGTVVAVY
jgi:hypothetical protein